MTTSLLLSSPAASGITLLASNVGFVHFDSTVQHQAFGFAHSSADAMAEIPCRLVRPFMLAPDSTLELVSTHALLGFTEEQDGEKPDRKWQVGIMKDRTTGNRELIFATNTFVAGILFQPRYSRVLASRTANTRRPSQTLKQLTTPSVSRIHFINFRECHDRTS